MSKMLFEDISPDQALHYIESLRLGIPPNQNISNFTVGRQSEIRSLYELLDGPERRIKLLQASYGSGKTHLLKLIQEEALKRGFATSLITLDAKSGVRFNRLDEIFGVICQNLIGSNGVKGIAGLLDTIKNSWDKRSNPKQRYSAYLNRRSQPIYQAVEWWMRRSQPPLSKVAIVEWLNNPHHFATRLQQEELFRKTVGQPYLVSSELTSLALLRRDGTFKWCDSNDYSRTWLALEELYKLTQSAGMRGLIILVDEFEDVISNMTRVQQLGAFYNLFDFYNRRYPGLAIFAVTPDFVSKCRHVLTSKSIDNFNIKNFQQLPSLTFSALTEKELYEFTLQLALLYEKAYQIKLSDQDAITGALRFLCNQVVRNGVSDQPRYIAKQTTKILDSYLED